MRYTSLFIRLLLLALLASDAGAAPGISIPTGFTWSRRDTQSPTGPLDSASAYDSVRGRFVMFAGGDDGGSFHRETWEYDGLQWVKKTETGPVARRAAAGAFDSKRGRFVIFGGDDGQSEFGDVWEFDGTSWSTIDTATPDSRTNAAMVYDEKNSRIILFGGTANDGGTKFDDTWAWNGTTWTNLSPSSKPLGRGDHGMAYDSKRGKVVLFGGERDAIALGDTWEFDGTNWKSISATGPTSRLGHGMSYDVERGQVVLFGGFDSSQLGDTWTWNGTVWAQVANTGPSARSGHPMEYDRVRNRIVLIGGYDGGVTVNDTWEWNGARWEERTPIKADNSPTQRVRFGMAYDTQRGKTLIFGGNDGGLLDDTWAFDGVKWQNQTPASMPSARQQVAMAHDPVRGRTVLFGGNGSGGKVGDTWEWTGTNWTQLLSGGPSSPTSRLNAQMVYDAARGKVFLFGGADEASPDAGLNDNWYWDGTSWSSVAATGPSSQLRHAMAYDAGRGEVVMLTDDDPTPQTWIWNGTAWTRKFPANNPPTRENASMAYDSERARVVLFGGFGADFLDDVWQWDGTNWSQLLLQTTPSARTNHQMVYDTDRRKTVLFGGENNGGNLRETWELGSSPPAISSTFSPNPVAAGASLTLSSTQADPDGESVAVRWRQLYGPPGSLATTPTWANPASSGPAGRDNFGMTYDAQRRKVVLFGGQNASNDLLGDTWEWDGASWAQVATTGPSARAFHKMVYDSARGRTVLFGGVDSGSTKDDTWEWNGKNWLQIASSGVTDGRKFYGLAYDSFRRRVVLFGGEKGPFGGQTDTWEYNGIAWDSVAVSGPGVHNNPAMAYDPIRRKTVLYGGSSAGTLDETWEWDGAGWTQVFPAATPGGLDGPEMVFDAAREKIVLFGGDDGETGGQQNTWEYDGKSWTRVAQSGPSGRSNFGMAYDTARGQSVLFGGIADQGANPTQDTWTFTGSSPTTTFSTGTLGTAAFLLAATDGHGTYAFASESVTVVTTPAKLRIVKVLTTPTVVSQGQTGIAASMQVANDGANAQAASISSAGLTFNGGSTGYTVSQNGNPASIAAGVTATFNFSVSLAANAAQGPVTIDGNVVATAAGANVNDATADATDTWTVQKSASIEISSIARSRTVVSVSQPLLANVTVLNAGDATASFTAGAITASGVTFVSSARNPTRTLAGGVTSTFTFDITPTSAGTLSITSATFAATDVNSGAAAPVAINRATAATVTVQTPTTPSIGAFTRPASAGRGSTFQCAIGVTNTGQAPGTVSLSSLTFSDAALTVTTPPGNPITLSSGVTGTFTFSVSVPITTTIGTVTATAEFRAVDANSGAVRSARNGSLGTIAIVNGKPIANAGGGLTTNILNPALDGRGSSDPEGGALTYSWSVTAKPAGSTATISPNNTAAASQPTVTVNRKGAYTVQLIVNDSVEDSTPSTTMLTIVNTAPVASAGPARTVALGQSAVLDGSATDVNAEDTLVYKWRVVSRPSGSTATSATFLPNDSSTAVKPSFRPDLNGSYLLSLQVADGTTSSNVSTVTVMATSNNTTPTAVISTPGPGFVGAAAALDGSASTDPETNSSLVYFWRFASRPAGSRLTTASIAPNGSAAAARTSFRPDVKGRYTVELVVFDGSLSSAAATAFVDVGNRAPVAAIATPAPAGIPAKAIADGSPSRDPDGDPIAFRWRLLSKPSGSKVTTASLQPNESRDAAITSFAPDLPGVYGVSLVVSDGTASSPIVTAQIVAVDASPIATFSVAPGASLTREARLDGSASRDSEGAVLAFRWRFVQAPAGSAVTTASFSENDSPEAVRTSFRPDRKGIYRVSLVVDDGRNSSIAAFGLVDVANIVPVADAGAAQAIRTGNAVVLDGRATSDGDSGDTLQYRWRFTSVPAGSAVTSGSISPNGSAAASTPSFTPDVAGDYAVELVVTDGTAQSGPSFTRVTGLPAASQAVIADIVPGRVLNTKATSILVTGAGFTGASTLRLSGQATVTLSPFQVLDDRQLAAVVPAGLPEGDYQVVAGVSGGSEVRSKGTLRVDAPRAVVLAPGTNGLVRYDASIDRDGTIADIQALLRVQGLSVADGSSLTLTLTRVVESGSGSRATFTTAAISGLGRFAPITLLERSTYAAQVTAPDGTVLSRGVLSNDGPPAAVAVASGGTSRAPRAVKLDGSSSVGERRPLVYRWTLGLSPQGAQSFDSTLPVTVYDARIAGGYGFDLAVSDALGRVTTDRVELTIANVPPSARCPDSVTLILPDLLGRVPAELTGTQLVLDGSASFDPNGDEVTYQWTLVSRPEGSEFEVESGIEGSTSARATLAFAGGLTDAGDYLFRLTVRDGAGLTSSRTVLVRVFDPNDLVPAADAGIDRTVSATLLSTSPLGLATDIADPLGPRRVDFVRLDGRRSVDPNTPPQPLTYDWEVVQAPAGSLVTQLTGASSATPRFVPDRPGEYTFRVRVSNLRFTSSDDTTVKVQFAGRNRPPRVEAYVEDVDSRRTSLAASSPLTFAAGVDRLRLHGSGSADPDAGDRLAFEWTQVDGPGVALEPSASSADPELVPLASGLYSFRLRVTDSAGVSSGSAVVRFLAVEALDTVPSLSVSASSSSTPGVGEDFAPGDVEAEPRSLRVAVGAPVTLTAAATDPNVGVPPLQQSLALTFEQVEGPTVLLLQSQDILGLQAQASFVPTTAGVTRFEVRAEQFDAEGNATGVTVSRQIRVVVDSPVNSVPIARPRLKPAKSEAGPCARVELDGTPSQDTGPNASTLQYRWLQVGGPPVLLSDPYSSITTFITIDLNDDAPRQYTFQLFVDDGESRSEPAPIAVVVSPDAAASSELRLTGRANFVTLAIDPGGGAGLDVGDLMEMTDARAIVGLSRPTDGSMPLFRTWYAGAADLDAPVSGGDGYLIVRKSRAARVIPLAGRRWSALTGFRALAPGLNFIGYPGSVPAGETAESLRLRTGARYVVEIGEGGQAVQTYVPGQSGPFPIEEGHGYLISVPASTVLTFPGCGE